MHEMTIRDNETGNHKYKLPIHDAVDMVFKGNEAETNHMITATVGGQNGHSKQTVSFMAGRVVGTGSFGVVFQAKCLETGEVVAIKRVLQDKRFKNRELQIMQLPGHPNVVHLQYYFLSTSEKNELYLNLVLEYVPETVYRMGKHYTRTNQHMPLMFVRLYIYQLCRALAYIHGVVGVCHRDIKPHNLLVLGTPTREEIRCMNPSYTEFKFPQINACTWHKIFHKWMPPEGVDFASRLLQYSPNLRSTALEACAHPFFDELRNPNACLPNGQPLPPLFNFTPQELCAASPELIQCLVPQEK